VTRIDEIHDAGQPRLPADHRYTNRRENTEHRHSGDSEQLAEILWQTDI